MPIGLYGRSSTVLIPKKKQDFSPTRRINSKDSVMEPKNRKSVMSRPLRHSIDHRASIYNTSPAGGINPNSIEGIYDNVYSQESDSDDNNPHIEEMSTMYQILVEGVQACTTKDYTSYGSNSIPESELYMSTPKPILIRIYFEGNDYKNFLINPEQHFQEDTNDH